MKKKLPRRHGHPYEEALAHAEPELPECYLLLLAYPASRAPAIDAPLAELVSRGGGAEAPAAAAEHEWSLRFSSMRLKQARGARPREGRRAEGVQARARPARADESGQGDRRRAPELRDVHRERLRAAGAPGGKPGHDEDRRSDPPERCEWNPRRRRLRGLQYRRLSRQRDSSALGGGRGNAARQLPRQSRRGPGAGGAPARDRRSHAPRDPAQAHRSWDARAGAAVGAGAPRGGPRGARHLPQEP